MRFLFFISLVFAIFLNNNIGTVMGLTNKAIVSFFPMMVYLVITLFTKKIHYNSLAIYLLVLAVVILSFKWSVGQNYLIHVGQLLVIPALMFICCNNATEQESSALRRLMILFFLLVCTLGIIEKTLNHQFFSFAELRGGWDEGYFRSTSFFEHPLQSGFLVAVIMSFVSVADFKKKYFQIFLFFLGYTALFCFDARGAILVATFVLLPCFLWKLFKMAGERKWIIILGAICMLFGLGYLIAETSLGSGRLMSSELMDDSAQTRLDVFNFHKHYKRKDDFVWGHPDNTGYMMERLGAAGVENGIITFILEYGIIIAPILLLSLFLLQYKNLSIYRKFDKWMLLLVFFGLGSTNPTLAAPANWIYWVFAYFAFKPEHYKDNINIPYGIK